MYIVYMYIYILIYICKNIYICIYECVCIYIYICVYIYIYNIQQLNYVLYVIRLRNITSFKRVWGGYD